MVIHFCGLYFKSFVVVLTEVLVISFGGASRWKDYSSYVWLRANINFSSAKSDIFLFSFYPAQSLSFKFFPVFLVVLHWTVHTGFFKQLSMTVYL